MIYAKINNEYKPVTETFLKLNGIYKTPLVYIKVNGSYLLMDEASGGSDPIEFLNSVEILNDLIGGGGYRSDYFNSNYGKGDNKDKNGNKIANSMNPSYTKNSYVDETLSLRIPVFSPQLSVSDLDLSSNNVKIAGSTASIKSKKLNKISSGDTNAYNILSNNVYKNLYVGLSNNNVRLLSNEKNLSGHYPDRDFKQSDIDAGITTNRDYTGNSDFCVGVNEQKGYDRKNYHIVRSYRWGVEVDVNYALTLIHTPSGQTRVINHVIRFRTY